MDIEEFKNDILFKAIHHEERYTPMDQYLEVARRIYLYNKGEMYSGESSQSIYIKIVYRIIYMKNLIKLCDHLQSKGYKLQMLVQVEDSYYQDFFRRDIKEAHKALRKLRPYVQEFLSGSPGAKENLRTNPELGKYFSRWLK